MGAAQSAKGRLRRGAAVAAIAGAGVLVLGGAAAFLLLGSHHAPPPLALSTPSTSGAQGSLVGVWKVADGSEAGYRVREKLVNQPASTEAVARTPKVAGSLQVGARGSSLVATRVRITADLTALVSQDRYATYQVYQRDVFIRNIYLETARFPTAVFVADSISLPADLSSPVTLDVPGKLTVHGFTKSVTSHLQVQLNDAQVEIAGSINVDMRDFAIAPPDIAFTTAEPGVVIEYHLLLSRS